MQEDVGDDVDAVAEERKIKENMFCVAQVYRSATPGLIKESAATNAKGIIWAAI